MCRTTIGRPVWGQRWGGAGRLRSVFTSMRIWKRLHMAGYDTIKDVSRSTADEILGIRGLGVSSLREIRQVLWCHDLTLDGDPHKHPPTT